jgi:serralysin
MDTLNFSFTTSPIMVKLGEGEAQVINLNLVLRLIACHSIENVIGGDGADSLTGNSLDNRLTGGGGDDTLVGGRGNDTYAFDADVSLGTDTINEDADSEGGVDALDLTGTTALGVTVNLANATPPAQVVNANLRIQLSSNAAFENVLGGQGGNSLRGNSLNNWLVGGLGNDTILGEAGDDVLEGRGGNDTLNGGSGNDIYKFNADSDLGTSTIIEAAAGGADTLDFSASTVGITVSLANPLAQQVKPGLFLNLMATDRIEHLTGGAGDDVLQGNSLENHLNGGAGNDRYVFDADSDLGSDIILESSEASGGVDTLDFSLTTNFRITLDLSLTARQTVVLNTLLDPDEIFLALELRNANVIEKVIGGARGDIFKVTPSTTMGLNIDGGGGADDVLNYDSLLLATVQTLTSLTTAGFQPVTLSNIEAVNILNPPP